MFRKKKETIDIIDEDEVNKEIDKVNDDYLEKGPEK